MRYALALVAILLIAPIYLMVAYSFAPIKGFVVMPPHLIPAAPTLNNYVMVMAVSHFARWVANSFIIVASVVLFGTIAAGSAGYAFAFLPFKGREVVFWILMSSMFVSYYALIVPRFQVVSKLGLHGLPAVIAMEVFWPTGIYLFRGYFHTIPASLLESARIDGAHEWQVFMRVVLPVCKPMIGCAVVFLGLGALQDFLWQMLVLQTEQSRTLLVGLMSTIYQTGGGGSHTIRNLGYDMAVGTVLLVPLLAIFAASSRYFVEGLKGAVKE
jgi:multiple sugar transport system permease protein